MLTDFKTTLQSHLVRLLVEAYPSHKDSFSDLELEIPSDPLHGEFASNIALKSAKIFRKPPMVIAQELVSLFRDSIGDGLFKDKISKIEAKNPGFINFHLTNRLLYTILEQVFIDDRAYGRLAFGQKKKVQIEFVSANPTGPLSVAHARQAAVGDALANILDFIGFQAVREYYINDGGNQINILGKSIRCRALEFLGQEVVFPEDGYQGTYIKDMAKLFMEGRKIKSPGDLAKVELKEITQYGVDYLLEVIKKDLNDFGVHFNVWSHESQIATTKNIEAILDYLGEKGFLYEKDGALWFKSTDFGDDKDRVVEKSDGTYTYLTPDIVYHKNKFDRGFESVINIWGPDHHGYIPRLKAAVEALGRNREALQVLIVQLATIYRNGKPVSMSTRRGEFISLREVIEEVGVDAARFFFLMRHINVHLDFDLELAKKETPENPVYYIQYAHARVHSINKKASEAKILLSKSGFRALTEPEELELIKKLGSFSDILMICYNELDPYPLVSYMQDLASGFHKFYDCHRVIDPDNISLSSERLALTNATRIVLANGLKLLGVGSPEQM